MLKSYKEFDLLSLLDFPSYQPLPDDDQSLESRAVQKAVHAARELNQWVISDQAGLFVPALQGEPGLHSARYAGPMASDSENRKKLLSAMHHLTDLDRQAYFECWLAIASPEGLKKCVRGVCEGTIASEERGGKGFGYDSLFLKYEYRKTFAELDAIKDRVSHRRKAVAKLHLYLESLSEQLAAKEGSS